MTRRFGTLVCCSLLLLAVSLPSSAQAEEDAPTVEELLRLAHVAERVERDPEKAQALYERALRSEDPALAARAGMSLAGLQERQGRATDALATLRALDSRFGDLPPRLARIIRAEIVRLNAPGAIPAVPTSPLELKIRAMFDRVEAATGDAVGTESNLVRSGLESVGRSVLPALERLVLERTPKTARLAAELYAEIGEADAIEGLERMAVAADPLTRPLVVAAFYDLPWNERVSPLIVAAVDRLLVRPELAEHQDTLRDILVRNVTTERLLPRHLAGGPNARFWLEYALDNEEPGAKERAVALIREGGESGKSAFLALRQSLGNLSVLGLDGAWVGLRAITELAEDHRRTHAVDHLQFFVELIEEQADAEAGAEARRLAWEMYATTESSDTRHFILERFRQGPFTPDASFFEDENARHVLFKGLVGVGAQSVRAYVKILVGLGQPFFDAFFAELPDLHVRSARRMLQLVHDVYADLVPQNAALERRLPPPEYDRAWLELLASPLFLDGETRVYEHHLRAALRSGDARTPDILRKFVASRGWGPLRQDVLFRALVEWEHAERIAFVEAFLLDPELPLTEVRLFAGILAEANDEDALSLLVRLARDPARDQASSAVRALTQVEARAQLLEVFAGLEEPEAALPYEYRSALVQAAEHLRPREAIPFLLAEFRRGARLAPVAARAMDAIRTYHDRLAEFEAYADGREQERAADLAQLETLLEDSDAEIRRAAILALAALGRTDALPRILALAKDDPDARVRQAALDAVERMAR